MRHNHHPLVHGGYNVTGHGDLVTITAPDGARWLRTETAAVVAALNHSGVPCVARGRQIGVEVKGRHFAGRAAMVRRCEWNGTRMVRPVSTANGVQWTNQRASSGNVEGTTHHDWCLVGTWLPEVPAAAPARQIPLYRSTLDRSTGVLRHDRCGEPIGKVVKVVGASGRRDRWQVVGADGGHCGIPLDRVSTARQALLMAHVPSCPHGSSEAPQTA